MPVTLLCEYCKKSFQRSLSQVQRGRGRFCSKSCHNHSMMLPDQIRSCLFCSKEFVLSDTRQTCKENRRYCSLTCAAKATAHTRKGRSRVGRALETFWQKVIRCDHEWLCLYCCWPWTGCIDNGYGTVSIRKQRIGTHRLAWELHNGHPMPKELFAAHYCHFRACCNPTHIHPADHLGNMQDTVRDLKHVFGERHYAHKLTANDVLNIFVLRRAGRTTQSIADEYHVTHAAITFIFSRRTWKQLDIPKELL
jgi:hypothetical protein